MIAIIWAIFISSAVALAYLLGTVHGHDEEHRGCRHGSD